MKYITPEYTDMQNGQSKKCVHMYVIFLMQKVFDFSYVHVSVNYIRIHFNILKAFFRILHRILTDYINII